MHEEPSTLKRPALAGSEQEIDRAAGTPYYLQLRDILLRRINSEGIAGGDRFWSENELCQRYGVSRSVVRQALAELDSQGVIERTRGRGTFLAAAKGRIVKGLYDVASEQGLTVTSRVLRQEIVPVDAGVAVALGTESTTPEVILIERVRSVGGSPWVHTTTWLPAKRFRGLEEEDMSTGSLYQRIKEDYGVAFGQVRRSVEAIAASEDNANLLGVRPGAPILKLHSTSWDTRGLPVETFVDYHRGDHSRLDVVLGSEVDAATVTMV